MSDKRKWPHAVAMCVAEQLTAALRPFCEDILICGSLRRQKPEVGDIEIVFIPRLSPAAQSTDLFAPAEMESHVDKLLAKMLEVGALGKRLSITGNQAWGPNNKLAIHMASGIAVDFFATHREAWWNYMVCRTGGAISNTKIAAEAKSRGWKWRPTSEGYMRRSGPDRGRMVAMHSEREVFEFVKMPYLQPEARP